MNLLIFLVIGASAGFIAGQMMRGSGYGLLINILLGIAGAFVGGMLFGLLGISAGGLIGSVITATVGAVLLLFVSGKLRQ